MVQRVPQLTNTGTPQREPAVDLVLGRLARLGVLGRVDDLVGRDLLDARVEDHLNLVAPEAFLQAVGRCRRDWRRQSSMRKSQSP